MKIIFKLKYSNDSEKELRESFCNLVVSGISHDIVNSLNIEKIRYHSDKILSMNWISWIGRPVNYLDPLYILTVIARNVEHKKLRNGLFVIRIDPLAYYPGSRTKLERFVRFLDKGNMTVKGSYIFTDIFNKYAEQINDLWEKYKSNKLRVYNIENSFIIK